MRIHGSQLANTNTESESFYDDDHYYNNYYSLMGREKQDVSDSHPPEKWLTQQK